MRAQVARLLASRYFARSPRLSRFLEYTVEQALAGHGDCLKEYLIGVEVFGRQASFDPRADGIVRVQAVNLRARLASYYETDGQADAVRIEYAKGSYAPSFRQKDAAALPAQRESPDSIAVLPFVNMSSDPENEYFSDGLTEELISRLSQVRGLKVVARTSVFQYKGKPADVRVIGTELNARMVLEGSVRKSAGRLCITAQLVDARNGYETWSRTYKVEIKDLFAVQREIADAIAATLGERERGPAPHRTENLEAYHAYLKGRFYLNKWSEEAFRKSAAHFEDAIRLDAGQAAAWSGLADALFVLACYGKMDAREVMPKARTAAERALELGREMPEAHVSLGAVKAIYDWDWDGAEEEFHRALELDPNYATAHQWYGVLCLLPQGRLEEAEFSIEQARKLDPLSAPINTSLGLVYFAQNRYDEAIGFLGKAIEIDPNFQLAHWWLGAIYLRQSMLLKAFASLRKAGALSQSRFYDAAKFTYGDALVGRKSKARKVLEQFQSQAHGQYVSPAMIAAVNVVLGETEAAFGWLDKAYAEHDAWLTWLGVDRRFDPLRADPRFTALLRRIGIGQVSRAAAQA